MIDSLSQQMRQDILVGLESADEELRRLAVERLLLLPIEEATAQLQRCLGDPGWRVRKAAIERVVAGRDEARVQTMLVESLADGENPGRRNAAFEALVQCGARVTPRLLDELDSPDVDVRKLVVDALASIGDPTTRVRLGQAIADEDPNVRAATAEALGVVGGVGEIATLLEMTRRESEDVLVRLSALRALCHMEAGVSVSSVGNALEQSLLRPAAFELISHSTDPEVASILLKGLSSGSRSSREAAIEGLLRVLSRVDGVASSALVRRIRDAAQQNEHLVESCCERLESANLATRMRLIQFLGLLDDSRVVLPILRAGRDEALQELADGTIEALPASVVEAFADRWPELESELRVRACPILGHLAGETAERLLLEALDSSDVFLRGAAARAIGEGGFFARLPALVQRLEMAARAEDVESDEEIETIVAAIVALADHPEAAGAGVDVQLIEMLSSRLAGAMEPVRLAIARVLGQLGREQDGDVIAYLLKDESAAVRRAAVRALARFEYSQMGDALRLALGDEASVVRIAAATVLGQSGCLAATGDLARQMADEDPRVVSVAVRSVGRLYRGQIASPEIEALIGPALEGEAPVALAGVEALMEMGGECAGRLVTPILSRPEAEVVRAGVACLGAHAETDSLDRIFSLVGHPDWSVRAEVVQVLADRVVRKSLPALLRQLEVETDEFVREAIQRAVDRLED